MQMRQIPLISDLLILVSGTRVTLNRFALPLSRQVCNLKVVLDLKLFLDALVTAISRNAFYQLWLIDQLKLCWEEEAQF